MSLRGDALLAEVRRAHPTALVDDCHDKCCKLVLDALPQRVILKGESLEELLPDRLRASLDRDKMPDRIAMVPDGEWVHLAVVELKRGRFNARHAALQVSNGVAVAERVLAQAGADFGRVVPYAFIAHGGGVRPQDMVEIGKIEPAFRKRRRRIRLKHCGERFRAILTREAPSYTPLGSGKATSRER